MKTIFSALLACLLWTSDLSAQTPFYEGKTVRILVGFSPGGAYDVWARLIIGANTFLEALPSWCKT
jgi:tripartite-type tricarboxylate transporter receptor subunit TctC